MQMHVSPAPMTRHIIMQRSRCSSLFNATLADSSGCQGRTHPTQPQSTGPLSRIALADLLSRQDGTPIPPNYYRWDHHPTEPSSMGSPSHWIKTNGTAIPFYSGQSIVASWYHSNPAPNWGRRLVLAKWRERAGWRVRRNRYSRNVNALAT